MSIARLTQGGESIWELEPEPLESARRCLDGISELVGQETEPMDGASVYAHYVKRVT